MQCAAHPLALQEIFQSGVGTMAKYAVLCSVIRASTNILSEYNELLGQNQFFQAWIVDMHSSGRLLMLNPNQTIPSKILAQPEYILDYVAASYFCGGHLFLANSMHNQQLLQTLASCGVRAFTPTVGLPQNIPGDNPIEVIRLDANSGLGLDVLDGYISHEDEIIVYDKYINQTSLELLCHIATKLQTGSSLHVYTKREIRRRPSLPTINQIESALASSNPAITSTCQEASTTFLSQTHDRYIFCGHRLQIVFSAGIDSIGPLDTVTGRRKNKMSEILIYTVDCSRPLQIHDASGNCKTVYMR
jgi:hypothetical protein